MPEQAVPSFLGDEGLLQVMKNVEEREEAAGIPLRASQSQLLVHLLTLPFVQLPDDYAFPS